MARHDEREQLLVVMCVDRRRLRYPLGLMVRSLEGQAMIHGLYKTEAAVLVHRRLILGRREAVVDVGPPVAGAKASIMSIVVLMVHANLGHEGIVHRPGGAGPAPGIE